MRIVKNWYNFFVFVFFANISGPSYRVGAPFVDLPRVSRKFCKSLKKKAAKQGIHPGFENPGQTSLEFQNRGISRPANRTYVIQKNLKKILELKTGIHSPRNNNSDDE